MNSVNISKELFTYLCLHHLEGVPDLEERIRTGLLQKLEAMDRRETYTKSKTAPTPQEREHARQVYLDMVGIPEDFRTTKKGQP